VPSASLAVEWIPIERVFLSPSNPRINDPAVDHVAASIRKFDWQQPIVAKRSGEVIAGNTRLKAAKSLGLTSVPVVWFEGTDLEATAYQVADNVTLSTWDEPALAKILEYLRAEDALEAVGFSTEDIDDLLAQLEAGLGPGEINDSGAGELPENAVTRRGDLWILGSHRLLCGDSAVAEDVDRLLGGARIHLVNTDPPYNVKVEPRSNNAIAAGLSSFTGTTHHQGLDLARHPSKSKPTSKLRPKDRPLQNDFLPDSEFARLLRAWFGNAARVLLPGRSFYVWGGYGNLGNYPPALAESGLYFSQGIVWDKGHPVLTRKDYMGAFEIAFYGWKEGAAHEYFGPNNATDLWQIKKISPQSMVHLTEKPVELAARAILYSSRRGENVLDLFGGSGSTLIGCEQTGRKAYLCELDEPYCDVIVERWQKASGKQAVLDGSGQSFEEIAAERRAP